ncbi:unnamed protein product [Candidula unifasciata]|uniref:Glutathione S-transferase n=1 Tax=Candidula unifasciata TaxID=100452 RepID=A0A8S3YKB5_9EUPU|nr:unnamed protein product [Candidula unifasciata]
MAPKPIKLFYFDARGRAEVCRLLLAAAGQKYEDIRYTQEQWETEKDNTPFKQLPVIEIDGKRFGQTIAIITYLATEFGFRGKTNLEALAIDQAVQLTYDFLNCFVKVWVEKDETKKAEYMKHFKEVEVPKYLGFYEKLLKESGTGYFVGNSLSVADLSCYDFLYGLKSMGVLSTDEYPNIQNLQKKVESNEKIKAYLATRKQTPT